MPSWPCWPLLQHLLKTIQLETHLVSFFSCCCFVCGECRHCQFIQQEIGTLPDFHNALQMFWPAVCISSPYPGWRLALILSKRLLFQSDFLQHACVEYHEPDVACYMICKWFRTLHALQPKLLRQEHHVCIHVCRKPLLGAAAHHMLCTMFLNPPQLLTCTCRVTMSASNVRNGCARTALAHSRLPSFLFLWFLLQIGC